MDEGPRTPTSSRTSDGCWHCMIPGRTRASCVDVQSRSQPELRLGPERTAGPKPPPKAWFGCLGIGLGSELGDLGIGLEVELGFCRRVVFNIGLQYSIWAVFCYP
jgi:hypothetical protein